MVSLCSVRECLCRFYLQSLDGFRAGEPAVQELIGKVARLVLDSETLCQLPDGQREPVHDPVMAKIPECYGQSPRGGGPYAPTLAELTKLLSVFLRFSIKAFLDNSKKSCEKIVSLSGSNIV